MTGRKLRPDEKSLWDEVAKTAQKIERARTQPIEKSEELPIKKIKSTKKKAVVSIKEPPKTSMPIPNLAMDQKKFQQLKRGKLSPESRIDLHGMTMDQAHPALQKFIKTAHASGKRLVLVITGKGKSKPDLGPIPEPVGVLRRAVPNWLRQPPLSALVLQIEMAHIRHGGAGAYYVYLRRAR